MSAETSRDRGAGIFWGIVMVAIGVLVLASQWFNLGAFWSRFSLFILPVLGVSFLAWGIAKREAGFLIPGGILSGLGVGVLITAGPPTDMMGDSSGGWFLISFGLGFASITLLTALFTKETHWWPLIPGGIMLLVGLAVLFGGVFEQLLVLLGYLWPLALIAGGVYIIYRVSQGRQTAA